MSDLVGNPEDRFSHNEVHIKVGVEGSKLRGRVSMMSCYSSNIPNSPLHLPLVQLVVSRSLPVQYLPPLAGLGWSHARRRRWIQSVLQVDQDDQEDQLPSTTMVKVKVTM